MFKHLLLCTTYPEKMVLFLFIKYSMTIQVGGSKIFCQTSKYGKQTWNLIFYIFSFYLEFKYGTRQDERPVQCRNRKNVFLFTSIVLI